MCGVVARQACGGIAAWICIDGESVAEYSRRPPRMSRRRSGGAGEVRSRRAPLEGADVRSRRPPGGGRGSSSAAFARWSGTRGPPTGSPPRGTAGPRGFPARARSPRSTQARPEHHVDLADVRQADHRVERPQLDPRPRLLERFARCARRRRFRRSRGSPRAASTGPAAARSRACRAAPGHPIPAGSPRPPSGSGSGSSRTSGTRTRQVVAVRHPEPDLGRSAGAAEFHPAIMGSGRISAKRPFRPRAGAAAVRPVLSGASRVDRPCGHSWPVRTPWTSSRQPIDGSPMWHHAPGARPAPSVGRATAHGTCGYPTRSDPDAPIPPLPARRPRRSARRPGGRRGAGCAYLETKERELVYRPVRDSVRTPADVGPALRGGVDRRGPRTTAADGTHPRAGGCRPRAPMRRPCCICTACAGASATTCSG